MKNHNGIEIVIQSKEKNRVASIEITANEGFGLKEYIFSIREVLKKTKRSLLELAIENEETKLNIEETSEEGQDGK